MSDTYLRIIPDDPKLVPSTRCERSAAELLKSLMAECEIVAKCSDEVQFIDAGENSERVLCSNCRADLTSLWPRSLIRLGQQSSQTSHSRRRAAVCQRT